ncbi:uncharacterized protein LOC128215372 [Mya arenaria]|uniref:uncharacterized protein LOC128215372 n=1 Tax=Mya arenaria TaxID=6604 RepID=UPI0022E13B8E|nr:uncharacterized protein LOC128215372 [Mya arenaria]
MSWFQKCIHAVLVILFIPVRSDDICNVNSLGTPSPNALPNPGLPNIVRQNGVSFSVNVQANLIEQRRTVFATVYFDNPGNRAIIKTFENGMDRLVLYNYDADEVYFINPDLHNCTVHKLSGSPFTEFFGLAMRNGQPHIGDVQTVLKFGQTYSENYLGNTTVGGIPVYHWNACVNNTLLIDYYFSRQGNWSTASTSPSVPVRAEVKGKQSLSNGTLRDIHHVYQYSDFIPGNDYDDSIFQTPTNVWCPGRKSTKQIPTLPNRFYYKTEIIYADIGAVSFEDVWYDGSFKLFRRDHRPILPASPDYTLHPRTDIQDFRTGVWYIIDNGYGNCSTATIPSNLDDSERNLTAARFNGSYVVDMKSPLHLLHLDFNYTYIGQNFVRGILCDTFVGQTHNFSKSSFVTNTKTADITFHFMAQGWNYLDDVEASPTTTAIPVMMVLYAEKIGFTATYNFVDFDPNPATLNVFDTSKCFPEANKITFQLKFPGTLIRVTEKDILVWAQLVLAEKMQVSVLRVVDVKLTYDDANIFIQATLLDKTSVSSQFTKVPGKTVEYDTDTILYASKNPIQCASFCENNVGFVCNSFDYCANDQSCHLSPLHTDDGTPMSSTPSCDHFSRTVDGHVAELTIAQAFQNLRGNVYNQSMILSNIGQKTYVAVDVTLLFGWVNPNVKVPKLSEHFSYKVEVTVPLQKHIYTSQVWYDSYFQLIRYDPHTNTPMAPFYTTNPLTVVEDFHAGIQYVIDKMHKNCTYMPLTLTDFAAGSISNSTFDIGLKDPLRTYEIDDTYRFVGQQTIRGMTCNIFESLQTNNKIQNKTTPTILRYAFLADDWIETSDGYLGGESGQPVRLDITVPSLSSYTQYQFFDFDKDHPDSSVFDVHQCYNPEQVEEFEIVFPGKYSETLNTSSKIFQIAATDKVKTWTGVSRMRLQQVRLDHDDDFIYFYATLVEQTEKMIYFTHLPNNPLPQHVDQVLSIPGTVNDCANTCYNSQNFTCNSFYYCADNNQCLLKQSHAPENTSKSGQRNCLSYSRTVNGTGPEPSNTIAMVNLRNAVYNGLLRLEIPIPNTSMIKTFIAAHVNDVSKSRRALIVQDNAFNSFSVFLNSSCISGAFYQDMLIGVSVDECALECQKKDAFWCRGFSYQSKTKQCFTTKMELPKLQNNYYTNDANCTTYIRKYLDEYIDRSGTMPILLSQHTQTAVTSAEMCAKSCTTSSFPCRSFQFCPNIKQCVFFKDREIDNNAMSNQTATCAKYTLMASHTDFQAVDSGTYVFGQVFQYLGITTFNECPKNCINDLGNSCSGFYYCQYTRNCYLTGADPNTGGPVNVSQTGDFCNQYYRTYYPPIRSNGVSVSTTVTQGSTSTVPAQPTKHLTAQKATATSAPVQPVTPPQVKPVTCPSPKTCPTAPTCPTQPSSTGQPQTTNHVQTPLQQQSGNNNGSNNAGLVAGVSIGTFLLGLVIGVIFLNFYKKRFNTESDRRLFERMEMVN